MPHYILMVMALLWSPNIYANEAAEKPAAHGKPEGASKPDEHGKVEGEGTGIPVAPAGPRRDYYPGKVLPFPSFTAQFLDRVKTLNFKPEKGHAAMIIFVASWCETCQVLMPDFKHLARKYDSDSANVFFVYAHDTKADAEGSAKEHQVTQLSLIANIELLTSFKNPEIPSVFVGDKWGYWADQFLNVKKSDIDRIDTMMGKITAL